MLIFYFISYIYSTYSISDMLSSYELFYSSQSFICYFNSDTYIYVSHFGQAYYEPPDNGFFGLVGNYIYVYTFFF
jgi:hypothetical protein